MTGDECRWINANDDDEEKDDDEPKLNVKRKFLLYADLNFISCSNSWISYSWIRIGEQHYPPTAGPRLLLLVGNLSWTCGALRAVLPRWFCWRGVVGRAAPATLHVQVGTKKLRGHRPSN